MKADKMQCEAIPAGEISRIAGFRKLSLTDWDGMVACAVFLSGCPWACPWCHNPSLIRESEGEPAEKLFSFIESKREWIDGVVVSGGEPLLRDDITGFLGQLRERSFKIKLDTNGSNPELLELILGRGLADYVALDIKSSLTEEKYRLATGRSGSNGPVRKSIEILSRSDTAFEFRTTLVPGIAEEDDVIFNLERFPSGSTLALQGFRPENAADPVMREIAPLSAERMQRLAGLVRDAGFKVKIRN